MGEVACRPTEYGRFPQNKTDSRFLHEAVEGDRLLAMFSAQATAMPPPPQPASGLRGER